MAGVMIVVMTALIAGAIRLDAIVVIAGYGAVAARKVGLAVVSAVRITNVNVNATSTEVKSLGLSFTGTHAEPEYGNCSHC
jgi:hypothetical protein